ncbi:alpha/beta-hydrolase [Mycena floridula]|nr:alpha/beta-hydrolase [Mycena floridula]
MFLGMSNAGPVLSRVRPVPALPVPVPVPVPGTTPLTAEYVKQILRRPALFSRAAYCKSLATTKKWNCGPACNSLGKNVKLLESGGDGGKIPRWYIAHDKDTSTIVVAHQGTDPKNPSSVWNDVKLPQVPLNSTLFKAQNGKDIRVHMGFQTAFERTQDTIHRGVRAALAQNKVSKLLITGHSLGAALAMMDSVLLRQTLPSRIKISVMIFGLPRVGNQAWANYVDTKLKGALTYVSNGGDIVTRVPPRLLSFRHPRGEVHIKIPGDETSLIACDGQENMGGSVGNSIFQLNGVDHTGPYFFGICLGGLTEDC